LLSGEPPLLPCVSIHFINWNSWRLALLALINSLIITRDLQANEKHTVEYFDFCLSIVHDILQAGSPSRMTSSSCIPTRPKITRSTPAT
jgi:hypothetical protein